MSDDDGDSAISSCKNNNESKEDLKTGLNFMKQGFKHYYRKFFPVIITLYVVVWVIYTVLSVLMFVFGFELDACPLNTYINVILIIFAFLIILAVIFHIIYLRLLNGIILTFFGFLILLIVIALVIGTIIIAQTISKVNFNNQIADLSTYCNHYVYMFFYWFIVIHDLILVCVIIHIVLGTCFMFSFSDRLAHRPKTVPFKLGK